MPIYLIMLENIYFLDVHIRTILCSVVQKPLIPENIKSHQKIDHTHTRGKKTKIALFLDYWVGPEKRQQFHFWLLSRGKKITIFWLLSREKKDNNYFFVIEFNFKFQQCYSYFFLFFVICNTRLYRSTDFLQLKIAIFAVHSKLLD